MIDFIATPFGYLFRFLNGITNNYILSLLLFAVFVEIMLIPLSYKRRKSSIAQKLLQPELTAIQNRYNDLSIDEARIKRQEDTIKLYEERKVTPFAGVGLFLIQFPILLALYGVITRPLKFLCGFSSDTVTNIVKKAAEIMNVETLSEIQAITVIKDNFNSFTDVPGFSEKISDVSSLPNISIFGIDVTGVPSLTNLNYLILVPVMLFVVSFLSTMILQYANCASWKQWVNIIKKPAFLISTALSPIISIIFSFSLPATIAIYWIINTIVSTIIGVMLSKVLPVPEIPPVTIQQENCDIVAEERDLSSSSECLQDVGEGIACGENNDADDYNKPHIDISATKESENDSFMKDEVEMTLM